jgi:peptidoglycan/LPS O-acetylase OafA/YrhL
VRDVGLQRFRHAPALDGLRGIAVSLVVISHLDVVAVEGVTPVHSINEVLRGGFLGVDLFFVLSGFLITTLLLQERATTGAVRLGRFFARRGLRLLPALYLFLIGQVAFAFAAGLHKGNEVRSVLAAVLYVSNWLTVHSLFQTTEGMGHLWSLAVEEQFYLVWPWVLLALVQIDRRLRVLQWVLVAAIVATALHRALLWRDGTFWIDLFVRTDTRIDVLLVGALLSVLWGVRPAPDARTVEQAGWIGLAVALGVIGFARPEQGFAYSGGLTLFALGAAAVVLAAVETDWAPNRAFRAEPLRAIGRVSYALYLWHPLVFYVAQRWALDVPPVPRMIGAVVVSIGMATLSWHLVERRALRLKERFEVRRHAPAGR